MRVLIFACILILFQCCMKFDERRCETWQVQDTCIPKTFSAMCLGNYSVRESLLCSDGLEGIYAGKVDTLYEDENYINMRTFIKKVR